MQILENAVQGTSRRARDERGQGLVEYALILALVSLAAIVALGFLSGKINSLFSKAGNSLNNVPVAAGGGPGGGGGTPPTLGTVVIDCNGNTCDTGETLTATLTGWTGATSFTYAWEQSGNAGVGCGSTGWTPGAVGTNSATLPNATPGGGADLFRVTVTGHNADGNAGPASACQQVDGTD